MRGVETQDGRRYFSRAVVLTAGTFLRGVIHMGLETRVPAGRAGDSPAVEIAQVIEQLGITVHRFKLAPATDRWAVGGLGAARTAGW